MRRLRLILVVLLLGVMVALAGFVIWASTPLGPMPEALAALESGDTVRVSTEPWRVWRRPRRAAEDESVRRSWKWPAMRWGGPQRAGSGGRGGRRLRKR